MHENNYFFFPYLAKEFQKYLPELVFGDFDYMEMLRYAPTKQFSPS